MDVQFSAPVTDHAASDDWGLPFLVRSLINSGMITKARIKRHQNTQGHC